eukprot:Blabericola_migrator_1__6415@NODE_3234_length_1927_cov_34_619355_g1993_i1_p3_GENE_NODE_3234_length_1927_cov_34_619355_g1993_i1NODE_3234_length_1927_cov_34_619355_g1993_i1_p3_ORF_typecomplete_len115_score22_10SRP921/PF05486_12/3_3e17HATPase_c_2/PF13581_6/0_22_NODE_3234_length_1927_cov_34_619355_g1993_i113721716
MVYLQNWNDFDLAVRHMYLNEPFKTRYSIKHRPSESELTIKVTDDVTCLQFRAHTAQHVKKIDALTAKFLAWSVLPQPTSLEDLENPMERITMQQAMQTMATIQRRPDKGVQRK